MCERGEHMNDKRIQKKKLILSLIMLLLFAASLIFSGITFAWLYKGKELVSVDTLSGSIHAAYFNGGNGSVPSENATYKTEGSTYPSYEFGGNGGPYQIDNATQLYNFAWLQYLGYFNDKATYFVLTNDIDVSDLVLPPIGTASSPFIGYFDGNGHTISGLNISNDKTKLNNTDVDGNKFNIPYKALENDELTDPAEIVGFFGVVGEIDEEYQASSFVPTVKNLKLSGTNIESKTAASLSGIAAGYVNGIMEDVVVSGTSTINSSASAPLSYTSELSDYALVGFCEEPYKKRLKVETVDVYEPDIELGHLGRIGDTGIGNVWGNSIDMKSMYNEVRGAYDAGSDSAISYISAKTIEHYGGTTSVVSTATGTVNALANGYRIKTTKTLASESGDELASYALIQQEGINNYVYLYGDKALATPSVSVTDIYYEDAFYIKDGENYLTAQLSNTTDINNAGKWVFQENNNGSFKIYTIINNAKKYLYKASGNSLAIGDTQDNWTVSTDNDITYVETGGLFLCLKNGVWTLIPPPTNYITDSAMTNYLSVSNGDIVNRTDAASATSWEKETVTGGYRLKTVIDDTTYYLRADSGYNIVLTTDSSESGTIWNESSGTDSVKPKVYTMVGEDRGKSLYFNGSVWKLVDYIIGVAGNDWGGSIDMLGLYGRLLDIYDNYTSDSGNCEKQEITYLDSDGNTIDVKRSYVGDEGHYKGYYSPTEDYSYTFNRHPNAATKNFMYLYGELSSSIAAGTETIERITMQQTDINITPVQITATETIHYFYIQCNGRYMTSSGGYVTSQANAALWQKEEIDDTSFYLYTIDGSTTRYIYATTTSVTIGNNKTRFYVDGNDQLYILSGNTAYYLYYYTGGFLGIGAGWRMERDPSTKSDLIPNTVVNNYAFSYTSSNGFSVVKNGSGSEWLYQDNKLFTVIDNTIFYFTKNGTAIELTDEVPEYDTTDWFSDETGFYYVEDGTNIYLHLYPSLSISTEPQELELVETSAVSMTNVWKRVYDETTSSQTGTNGFKGSYMPLTVEDDIFKTSPLNTGYIVSGKKSAATNNYNSVTNETDYYGAGDIRVSKYAMTSISDKNVIYTINSSGKTSNRSVFSNFVKYETAKAGLDEMLEKDSEWIYGLHFMNAAISRTSLVTLPKATINGQTFQNYQVPQDCIDFNLKEAGYINFFAGTYFSGNKSFFSLHQITRNSNNAIIGITEIKKIYRKTDGTYAYNTQPAGSTLVFDTDWITAPNTSAWQDNALYYFEIPVNEGEYALGSTNSNGAYLLYLDISANAKVEGDSQFNAGETYEPVEKASAQLPVSYSSNRNETIQVKTSPTYFPLAWADGDVSASNTGYIISGGDTNSLPPGDIRVSRYEKSNSSNWRGIGRSLTNGILTDSKIYTYQWENNGGWKTISQYGANNLYKYLNSKAQLQETIGSNTTGDVFGLHFMDASISKSNLLTIPNATINGQTYTDYEMPRDSIDFTLKTSGYINVFAGTYFSGASVDCFFSLHKIERDEDQHITSIREIKAIYEDNGSYNYQYAGGAAPSGTKVFDTDCLTQPSGIRSDTVYYFEIPVSAGEFAIGSVSGGNGGYLLYLDISTHQGDSVITREKMTVNTVEYEIPEGVTFEGADKTVFKVPTAMTGDISFTVNNGTVTSVSALTPISEIYSKTTEKVAVSDRLGGFNIKRTTESGTVTYEYSERPLDGDDSPTTLAAYFDSSVNNVIFTYYYEAVNGNSVDNNSDDIEYSTDVGLEITGYNITARAVIEEVTALVQVVERSYIGFNGDSDIQTNQTIVIPIQTTTT